jgi:hypothetical protein
MAETKIIKKPKTDKYTRMSTYGQFKEKPEGFFWEETLTTNKWDKEFKTWVKVSDETTLKNPEDSPLKLKKSVIAHIIFVREDENKNKWNSVEKSYFYLKLQYTIKDSDNLFFAEVDGKLMVRDLKYGVTAPIALNQSNENYKCVQIGEIERITATRATEIVKETGTRLIFSKVETDGKGEITSFGTGVSA